MPVAELGVVGLDPLADGVRLSEVERRARDVGDLTRRDQHRIDRRCPARADRQHVVEHRAVPLTLEVEERVVREVHDGRFVGRGLVIDAEFVLGGHRIGHPDLQVARESLLAVAVEVAQHELLLRCLAYVPHHAVESRHAAVERLPVVVGRERVLRAVEREASGGDAVGVGTHDGSEEPFARVVHVAVERLVSQYDVFAAALAVGGPQRDDAGAVVGRLQRDVARMERVEVHLFPVDGGCEALGRQQFRSGGLCAAARQ